MPTRKLKTENLTQRRKGAKEREKPEIAAKRHKTHKKEALKFGKRTFIAAVWIGLKLGPRLPHDGRLTIQFF